MKLKGFSLIEVAALASKALARCGIEVALVGGSAITAYVPRVYTSLDIDFAAINGTTRRAFGDAVAKIGFRAKGRDFVHADTVFSLDYVADTPFIDKRAIEEFTILRTRRGPVRVLRFEDAIGDRIAAFLHWFDSQSLDVAERAVKASAKRAEWMTIEHALDSLDASGPDASARMTLAKDRLRTAWVQGRFHRAR